MSVLIQGDQIRALLLGVRVQKATVSAPQSTSAAIFNVTGGKVAITSIVGEVTTVIGGTTVSYNVTYTKSGGSAVDLCAATVCTSDAVGTLYSVSTGVATDLLSAQTITGTEAPNVTFAQLLRQPIIVDAGSVNWKTSASTTGAVTWNLTYIPYDNGAAVAAA